MTTSFFDRLIKDGVNRIYSEDLESQKHFINIICEDVRHMSSDILFECKAFFVPNNDYMKTYFGMDILNTEYDCYDIFGNCKYDNYLVFMLLDVLGNVVGLTGFNPFNSLKKKEFEEFKGVEVYKDSGKALVEKSKYFLAPSLTFKKALEEGYIILTDGVFDMFHLSAKGFVSGALLGSYLSDEMIGILKLIPQVYLARDNDNMGVALENKLKKYMKVKVLSQSIDKDVDGVLKSSYSEEYVKQLKTYLKNPINDFKFNPSSHSKNKVKE